MSAAGGLENALLIARGAKCRCVQFFSANQRQWRAKALTAEQIDLFRQTYATSGLETLVVHGSYLINLAATNREFLKKSIAALVEEFVRCDQLGSDFLVLHPGADMGAGETAGIAKVAASLNRVLNKDWKCQLLLETTAGQGSSLGHRFEQLAAIIASVERPEQIGVCLDTCHVFAAGYELRSRSGFQKTIRQFKETVGLERLKVLHVNDSRTDMGSRVDRHDHIGKGKIGKEAFGYLVNDARLNRLPFILETPKGKSPGGRNFDMLNLATLRRLVK